MFLKFFISGKRAKAIALTFSLLFVMAVPLAAQDRYHRDNLVSDIPGVALRADANLVNPWGMAFSATSPIWIADNGTGVSTIYRADGSPIPLVVTIPGPSAGTTASPTGLIFNGTPSFVVSSNGKSGVAIFIFVTEDGTINGWSPAVDLQNAIQMVNNSSPGGVDNSTLGAVYKGLATGTKGSNQFLFATNFRDAVVEIYDSNFHFVKSFTDPNAPAGFAPFGIQNINGHLFVTFAKQNDAKHDDVAGPGNGVIDIFDTDGNLLSRFASGGALNSPWGLALAPAGFGIFSQRLIVGNFGDGHISAFDIHSGIFEGQLKDILGQPMNINGLWALKFGSGSALSGPRNHLLFTAGIGDESHGLFGVLRPVGEEDNQGDE